MLMPTPVVQTSSPNSLVPLATLSATAWAKQRMPLPLISAGDPSACDPYLDPTSLGDVAGRLGVSDRHLRRIFQAEHGVTPLQYLQTRRLLAAKQLIADTQLPMTQVALASGFASVRRFNAAFLGHYGLNPSALRRAGPSLCAR